MRFATAVCFWVLIAALSVNAQQQDSSLKAAADKAFTHQLRFSFDISRPIISLASNDKTGYELALDYSLRKEIYATIEGGFGGSNIAYPNLNYSTNNSFFRIGIDKTMLPRFTERDWDMVFVGVRYGMAFIHRNDATFTTNDNFWGPTSGTIPSKNFIGHWAELTGGIKVELFQNFFVGWTIRGKFLINQTSFRELPPAYVAGYGKGERNTIFDFNLYACYALRWMK